MSKNIVIAFLIGLLLSNLALAMKVPDIILGENVDTDLRELIEDYVIKVLNNARYQMRVSSAAIASTNDLEAGEFLMDDSGALKYFIVSNGSTNYRVQVTAIP